MGCSDGGEESIASCCCRSPKSPGLVSGIKSKQMLVSLLAFVCGLFLLLRYPLLLQSDRWRPVLFSQDYHGSALMNDPVASNSAAAISPSSRTSCDYSVGRWIKDNTKPRYTGRHCSQWLSRPWMCRLDRHHNLSFEHYRWQPSGCDLPAFDPALLLHRMRDKTLAFVGDSLGRQQFQSMVCMLVGNTSAPKIKDVSSSFGLGTRGEGAYTFVATNTTVLFHWSASLGELRAMEEEQWALHVDRPPRFLAENAHRLDVVVVNTGHHWNRGKIKLNKWRIHVGGKVADKLRADVAKRMALASAAKWLGEHRGTIRGFVRSLSPRHFRGGDWDSGGRCDGIREISDGKEEYREDLAAREAVDATQGGVRLLDIGRLSWTRGDAHISSAFMSLVKRSASSTSAPPKQDCLHWCLPGVPDTWNELLFASLVDDS